jgi:hypothetical protein
VEADEAEVEAGAVVVASPEAAVVAVSPEAAVAVSPEAAAGVFREGVQAAPLGLMSLIVQISEALVRRIYRVPDEAAVLAIELPVSG